MVRLVVMTMCVNDDVERVCMDERMEGHDDFNTCVRTYNINNSTVGFAYVYLKRYETHFVSGISSSPQISLVRLSSEQLSERSTPVSTSRKLTPV